MADTVSLDDESIRRLASAMTSSNAANNRAPSGSAGGGSSGSGFGSALTKASGAAAGFTGFIGDAGGSVNTFAKAMGGGAIGITAFGGAIDNTVGFIEGLNNTFQNLSKVGAGFNGDLGALSAAAANTRMQVGEFADVVGNNAKGIAGLGAGVNKGAQRFSDLSRAMFEDGQVIEGMLNLGYNIRESNEALLDNATLLSRQQKLTGMSDDAVAQATLEMASNMAMIAEITGKSSKQQREELIDASRDGKNIAANRAMEQRGIKDATQTFNQVFSGLGPLGTQAQAYAQDLGKAGVPLTQLTRNFNTIAPQTAKIIKEMQAVRESNLSTTEKTARIDALTAQAKATYAKEMQSENVIMAARLGDINQRGAQAADQMSDVESQQLSIDAARVEIAKERAAARGEKYTGGTGDVTISEGISRRDSDIAQRNAAQKGGGAEGQAISREMNLATVSLANSAAGVNKEIGRNLSANTELQGVIATGLRGLGIAADGIAALTESAIGLLPGNVDQSEIDRNPFKTLFEGVITNNAMNTRIANLDEVMKTLDMNPEVRTKILEEARNRRDGGDKALGGPISAGTSYRVGERGPETFVSGMDGAIIPNMKSMLNRMPDMAKQLQQDMMQTGAPMSQSAQSAMATMGVDDIGTLIQHAQLTNELLSNLLGVNTTQARTGEKHLRSVRGAGNLMNGIGRAS